jgi:8-amino-7-oxononanoate synthase
MRRGVDGDGVVRVWDSWTRDRIESLTQRHVLRSLRPVDAGRSPSGISHGASSAEVWVSEPTMRAWETGTHDLGGSADGYPTTPAGPLHSALISETTTDTSRPLSDVIKRRKLKLFSSNDYLGLGAHPSVRAAAARAAAAHGSGPRSSPLVCGYTSAHRELELGLAKLKRTEECLLFPSGFAANLGTIPALADSSACEIFSDRLNHASIVDGCRLARSRGATITIYEHNDVGDLRTKLLRSNAKRKLIVTDALFSVDGDWAPLRALACLKRDVGGRDGDVMLLVDEAHATLVCGTTGGGAVEMFLKDNASPGGLLSAGHRDTDRGTKHENEKEDLSYLVDAHVGTLSKAFGSHGGFVCVSRALKSVLLSTTRTAVFSTALPAPCVAAACASLRVAGVAGAGADEAATADEGRVLREKVWRHVRRANDALRGAAFFAEPPSYYDEDENENEETTRDTNEETRRTEMPVTRRRNKALLLGGSLLRDAIVSPIFCVEYGSESAALSAAARLLRMGLHAPAIRPPTVPLGTSRVRIALSAAHSDEDIDALIDALTSVGDARL